MARKDVVPVETVDVGDRAAFTYDDGDMTVTNVGTVANVRCLGSTRVLQTECGNELVRYNITAPSKVHCTMLQRYEPRQPDLFGGEYL